MIKIGKLIKQEIPSFYNKIIYLKKVDSTNLYLKLNEFPDKTIAYTFNQTNGRGRNRHEWIDFKNKNIAISLLLKPRLVINHLWYIACCAISLVNLLDRLKIKHSWIKWPNDVYIGKTKLSGILAESVWQGSIFDKIIIGIGINVNNSIDEIKQLNNMATSLYIESGKKHNLKNFFLAYINELSNLLLLIDDENGLIKLRTLWLEKSKLIGQKVIWMKQNNQRIEGVVAGLELDGFLNLLVDNKIEKVIAGDINLV